MKLTLTAKVKILPTDEQMQGLQQTLLSYRKACNFLSNIVFETKNKRSRSKQRRKQLQQVGTASARRALKKMGQRENRYMTDVNHRIFIGIKYIAEVAV